MVFSESTILFGVVGFVGLIATLTVWLRSNHITSKYYGEDSLKPDFDLNPMVDENGDLY